MKLDRRFLLRGSCQGALAVMALPFLDCFLDSNGQALAATGQRIPTRFNTFFYGLGLTKSLWVPKTAGLDYEMTGQLKPLEAYRKKLNVFSGLRVLVDDNPKFQHWSGVGASATGIPHFRPKSSVERSIIETSRRTRCFRLIACRSATFRLSVVSAYEPPSMYSNRK